MSPLDKHLLRPLDNFLIGLFFVCVCDWVVEVFNIVWIWNPYPLYDLKKKKKTFYGLPLHSVDNHLWFTEVFNFDEAQFTYSLFCCLCLSVSNTRNHGQMQRPNVFPYIFFYSSYFMSLLFLRSSESSFNLAIVNHLLPVNNSLLFTLLFKLTGVVSVSCLGPNWYTK